MILPTSVYNLSNLAFRIFLLSMADIVAIRLGTVTNFQSGELIAKGCEAESILAVTLIFGIVIVAAISKERKIQSFRLVMGSLTVLSSLICSIAESNNSREFAELGLALAVLFAIASPMLGFCKERASFIVENITCLEAYQAGRNWSMVEENSSTRANFLKRVNLPYKKNIQEPVNYAAQLMKTNAVLAIWFTLGYEVRDALTSDVKAQNNSVKQLRESIDSAKSSGILTDKDIENLSETLAKLTELFAKPKRTNFIQNQITECLDDLDRTLKASSARRTKNLPEVSPLKPKEKEVLKPTFGNTVLPILGTFSFIVLLLSGLAYFLPAFAFIPVSVIAVFIFIVVVVIVLRLIGVLTSEQLIEALNFVLSYLSSILRGKPITSAPGNELEQKKPTKQSKPSDSAAEKSSED